MSILTTSLIFSLPVSFPPGPAPWSKSGTTRTCAYRPGDGHKRDTDYGTAPCTWEDASTLQSRTSLPS